MRKEVYFMKKYELTDETKEFDGKTLYRIRALIDFRRVKAGDFGGWIEKEENLSQEGRCWVYDDACIYGNARVFDNGHVFSNANVFGNAKVSNNARVSGNACVFDYACVFDNAYVFDNAVRKCLYTILRTYR
jgi:carbonic anhydrase/acetyltransferase-like protein (isoleucine patch superfamily)